MNCCKKRRSFISLVCAILLVLSIISVPVSADDLNRVTASTGASVTQGDYAYCYVYIDSAEGLAALDVTVHYDPSLVQIVSTYNSLSCTLYDSATDTDSIRFSYILDGQGSAEKTRLFYFRYRVLSGAPVGDAYFDITVGEAYDSALNEMAIYGSRCRFTIAESVQRKNCSIYGSHSAATAVGQEFTLSYRLSTREIASGTVVITYDSELFRVVGVTNGAFLSDKIADINTDLTGEIYISFVGTEYSSATDLISVTFRTLCNVSETSEIRAGAKELLDKGLNAYTCTGYTTAVTVAYDETYTGDSPSMRLDGTFSYEDKQITLTVSLEEGSRLGAGDFVIGFDPKLVTYRSCNKGFAPTFFNVNDKNTDSGKLKFNIISLSDIVTDETVLTVVFDVNWPYSGKTADFTLSGTGLTDSMTEGILLNFIDDSVWLEYRVSFLDEDGRLLQSDMYHYGDKVTAPEAPTKESDVYGNYTFSGWDKPVTDCIADATYIATYTTEYIDYTVVFKDWDGTELSRKTYHYGDKVTAPEAPVREKDSTYTYTFAGWDNEVVDCNGNATYTATYTTEYIDYTVVFKDWDGTELSRKTYHYGDKVTAPETPTKESDVYGSYTFSGWDKPVTDCIADATYTATYTTEYIDYTVIFKDWDGTELSRKTYHYGDKVTVPEAPVREKDSTYTYTFAGWDNEVVDCSGNATYTATYTTEFIDYTVVFKDWDGTELSRKTYHYGDKVTAPEAPVRADDSTYTYTFSGWDSEVVACNGNATYTATYTTEYIDYTVIFKDWDGTELSRKTYHYGDKVTVPESPTKESDVYGSYTFSGWDKPVTDCIADATYTATYTTEFIDYTVVFKDWDGTELSRKTYHYGDKVTAPDPPVRAEDNTYTYTFAGWDSEVVDCSGNATYTATYTTEFIDYTIIFKDWDGTELSRKTYHYGDKVTAPEAPVRAKDNTYTYTFAGWDNEVVACNGNATYTATYDAKYLGFLISGTVTALGAADGEITIRLLQNGAEVVSVISADGTYSLLAPEPGDYVLSVSKPDCVTKNYEITVEGENILLDLEIYLIGDLNHDGEITAADALMALQIAVGKLWPDEDQAKAADVDGEGGVTATDALLILQYAVGKIEKFPVKKIA